MRLREGKTLVQAHPALVAEVGLTVSPRRGGVGSSYAFLDHRPLEKWEKASDSPRKCSLGTCSPQGVSHPAPSSLHFVLRVMRTQGPSGVSPSLGPWSFTFKERAFVFSTEASVRPLCPVSAVPQSCAESRASPPGDGYYLAVGGAVAQHNWSHITTVLQDRKFRCQLVDSSEDLGLVSVQGPAR